MSFDAYFRAATGFSPLPWQRDVGANALPGVLSVPTGLGKTEGAVLAWSWRRWVRADPAEPSHLIYCLPMRVLVRQTTDRLKACFGRLRDAGVGCEVPVFQLMGGDIEEDWEGLPEQDWVLVGTQDQLLSRALNRGYCASPHAWPVHFGILNNDCRWVLDEVQLMGPGLWTSAQLDWMRVRRFGTIGPAKTTWMSATMGGSFLDTRDRRDDDLHELRVEAMGWEIPPDLDADAKKHLERLRDAQRVVELVAPPKRAPRAEWLAREVEDGHQPGTLSLVVCNTVSFAQEVFTSIATEIPTILLTSRFRGTDRERAECQLTRFENRRKAAKAACVDGDPGLICVSTQVVEAGVDVSSNRLWSEAAPWPSIVQRLGRMNRDGRDCTARACFLPPDRVKKGSDRIGPYPAVEVCAGHQIVAELAHLSSVSTFREAMSALSEGTHGEAIAAAFAPKRMPLPRAADVHGLFSTERDVFGGFTDVSEFVRSPDPSADVTMFWRSWVGRRPAADLDGPPFAPRAEGCSVPAYRVRELLGDRGLAWRWETDHRSSGAWVSVRAPDVRPGMALMLEARQGGYDVRLGWTGRSEDVIAGVLPPPGRGHAWDDETTSETEYWASLSTHLADARVQAERLVKALQLREDLSRSVVDAARFHDLGKAHPQWQAALPGRIGTDALAKSPRVLAVTVGAEHRDVVRDRVEALLGRKAEPLEPTFERADETLRWSLRQKLTREQMKELRTFSGVIRASHTAFRPGLRHEVASALALWAARHEHALSGLAVYLAACHHGKARTVLRSRMGDDVCGLPREPRELEHNGTWRLAFEIAADGAAGEWVEGGFRLMAPGWTGLVAELLGPARPDEPEHHGALQKNEPRGLGPFKLAYLEALVRVADWRASATPSSALRPGRDDVV